MTERAPTRLVDKFLRAVYEGDADLIWSSFSRDARRFIIARGLRRGLSPQIGEAILAGTADDLERREFLGDLLLGLEKDLSNVDLDRVAVSDEPEPLGPGRVRVRYYESFAIETGPPLDPLPVGAVVLSIEAGEWRIERLIPRPG